jgi:Predicted UDP-glucose 6-dehydrogenase
MAPGRLILGGRHAGAMAAARDLFRPLSERGVPILEMDAASAEFTKFASGAMLAARLSLMNELAEMCEHLGADVEQVRAGLGHDRRIGTRYLQPGPGFGGPMMPPALRSLAHQARAAGAVPEILDAVMRVNFRQRQRLVERVLGCVQGAVDPKVAVMGAAFKPGTDCLTDAPAVTLIEALLSEGVSVHAYDPLASATLRKTLTGHGALDVFDDAYGATVGTDVLVLATADEQWSQLELARIRGTMRGAFLIDACNSLPPADVRRAGFAYQGVGRPE